MISLRNNPKDSENTSELFTARIGRRLVSRLRAASLTRSEVEELIYQNCKDATREGFGPIWRSLTRENSGVCVGRLVPFALCSPKRVLCLVESSRPGYYDGVLTPKYTGGYAA